MQAAGSRRGYRWGALVWWWAGRHIWTAEQCHFSLPSTSTKKVECEFLTLKPPPILAYIKQNRYKLFSWGCKVNCKVNSRLWLTKWPGKPNYPSASITLQLGPAAAVLVFQPLDRLLAAVVVYHNKWACSFCFMCVRACFHYDPKTHKICRFA